MAGERDAGSSNPTRTASGFAGARPSAAADEFGVISERIVPSSRSPSSRAPASSPSSPPVDSDTPSDGANEEFLFHLYRGSELLQDNRVREAKEELERALGLQPKDPQGQDLLAVVYFRLGMYPRAITILERLKAQSPHEPALMLSLSLCYLKTAQPARARDELSALVAMNPGHARAWGYLGLAYERLGDMERARDAFDKGGHTAMAKRVGDRHLASQAPAAAAPSAPSQEFREVVSTAFEDLTSGAIDFKRASSESSARATDEGEWRSVELGAPKDTKKPDTRDGPAGSSSIAIPRLGPAPSASPRRPTLIVAPPPADEGELPHLGSAPVPTFEPNPPLPPPPSRSVIPAILPPPSAPPPPARRPSRAESVPPVPAARLVDETAIQLPDEGSVLMHPSGLALVRLGASGFSARLEAIRATPSGSLVRVLERRSSGRTTGESFGGVASPVARVDGEGVLLLGPRPNRKLSSFLLEEEIAFVREEVLLGFASELEYENGRVTTGEGEWVAVVQLKGRGAVLTEVLGEVLSLKVTAQRGMIVRKEALLGWLGRLVPRALPPGEAPAGQRGLVSFAGEGTLIMAGV
ncbi:MAG: tetratricopeptide repeat protein [Polyangiaceae bacterium]